MKQAMVQKARREGPEQEPGPNRTGIPTQMKLEFERRTGRPFDGIRVIYNSDKPARYGALACTQGARIDLAPGQEKHLPHELVHADDQRLARVPVTSYINGVPANEDGRLEARADRGRPYQGAEGWPRAPRPVLQFKKVGVTLSVASEYRFPSDTITVDTITFGGRFPTGLENDSQGDHTIADIAIKKYQTDRLKGQTAEQMLEFYFQELEPLDHEINLVLNNAGSIESCFPGSSKERFLIAKSFLQKAFKLLDMAWQCKFPLYIWNILLKDLIKEFNLAYSHSPFSTQGTGSGGRGEAAGVKARRDIMHRDGALSGGELEAALERLLRFIDMDSLQALAQAIPKISLEDLLEGADGYLAVRDLLLKSPHFQALLGPGTEKNPQKQSGSAQNAAAFLQTLAGEAGEGVQDPVIYRFMKMLAFWHSEAASPSKATNRKIAKAQLEDEINQATVEVWAALREDFLTTSPDCRTLEGLHSFASVLEENECFIRSLGDEYLPQNILDLLLDQVEKVYSAFDFRIPGEDGQEQPEICLDEIIKAPILSLLEDKGFLQSFDSGEGSPAQLLLQLLPVLFYPDDPPSPG